MITAGIRELKIRLSSYIRRVQAGERVRVTARGRTVAVLSPPAELSSPARRQMEELARSGLLILGNGRKPLGLNPPVRVKGKPLSRIIIEDRG